MSCSDANPADRHRRKGRGTQFLPVRAQRGIVAECSARKGEADREQVIRTESGIDRGDLRQAPRQQPRPHEQHHGERQLGRDHHALQTSAPANGLATAADQQPGRGAGECEGGRESEEHAGHRRDDERRDECPAVYVRTLDSRLSSLSLAS